MSGGLVLRLRPSEKFLVNGVVIENGDRRTRLRIRTEGARILRIRDALHPDEVNTPAKRVYFAAQLAVLGEADEAEAQETIVAGIRALRAAFGETICTDELAVAMEHAEAGRFYQVMRSLIKIMPHEKVLLSSAKRETSHNAESIPE